MFNKTTVKTMLITLLIADMIFAALAIPFAMTIVSSAVYGDSFGDYLEFISTISFACFAVTTIVFAIISFMSGRLPESKKAFDALVKQLAKALNVRFEKRTSMAGPCFEGAYQGSKLKISLVSGGGTTISSNFINIVLYHETNLNMGLMIKSKNITLLSRDEYRDLMARRVRSSERALKAIDVFAIRNNLADILINTDRVIDGIANVASDIKAIGAGSETADKFLNTGSGFLINDKYVCVRIFEDVMDNTKYQHLPRLIADACQLSRSASNLRLSPSAQSLIPAT